MGSSSDRTVCASSSHSVTSGASALVAPPKIGAVLEEGRGEGVGRLPRLILFSSVVQFPLV